jgi:hypothetical protein
MKMFWYLLTLTMVCGSLSAQTVTVISDDFNAASLDSSKWTTVTAGIPGATVVQNAGHVELANRGYLVSIAQPDPQTLGGLRITGHWRFDVVTASGDLFQVLTRCDGVPSGQYYEAQNGLQFYFWFGPGYNAMAMDILAHGSQVAVSDITRSGTLSWVAGADYFFDIKDNGATASFSVEEVGNPTNFAEAHCSVTTNSTSTNHVVFHNREYYGGNNVAWLEDVLVESTDCNSNGIADGLDISQGTSQDCNGNGVPDSCDITASPSLDLNGNGILDSCECLVASYCTAAPNSVSAGGALMNNAGTVSVGQNNLTLLCNNCPPNTSGVFFYGPLQTQVVFGNGYRCVAGPVTRLGLTVASPAGIAAKSLNYPTLLPTAAITPGSTWNFQFWYRNPAAGGAGFNLSNGLSIRFCP